MKKALVLTTGAALTVAGLAAAKPLAFVGLGSLVLTAWMATFQNSLSSDLLGD